MKLYVVDNTVDRFNGSSLLLELPKLTDAMVSKAFGKAALKAALDQLEEDPNKGTVGFCVRNTSDNSIYTLYKNYNVWRIGGWDEQPWTGPKLTQYSSDTAAFEAWLHTH